MSFEYAKILWLLLVIPPVLALFFWWGNRVRQKLLTQFVETRLLSSLTVGISPARRKFRFAMVLLAVVLLIFTIAKPQRGFDLQQVEQRGLDIVVAVDTSKSMLATDIAPSRLGRAKLAALELMQRAATDRIGLVAFAGQAFLECPLTIDNTAFQQSVQALDVNSIPEGGTAIAEAINTALTAFKEGDHYKALVLLTDGEDNDEGALEAAQNAAKEGLKVFTIGVGTTEGTLVTIKGADGNTDYIRDEKGQVLKSKLDERLLQEIAKTTGGFYLPLRGADTMDILYDKGLSLLPKSEGTGRVMRRFHEQYHWFLALAMLLLIAEMLFPERKTSAKRAGETPPQVQGQKSKVQNQTGGVQPVATALLVGLLFLPLVAKASPTSALRQYQSGNYTNALNEYTKLAEVQTNDLRLVFNAGDAAYRATNFDLAQDLFMQVTLSPDLKLQQKAFYNLGNVQFRIGQFKEDLDEMQKHWEEAVQSYQHAHELNTNDVDATFNLEFARQCVAQVAQFRELARRAKAAADDAARRRDYHHALMIMMDQLQKNPASKQFQDYVKRLKDIDDIATPHQP